MVLAPLDYRFPRAILDGIVAHIVQDGVHVVLVQKVAEADQIMRVNLYGEEDPIGNETRPITRQGEHLEQRAEYQSERPNYAGYNLPLLVIKAILD